jgi:hypothetical protein
LHDQEVWVVDVQLHALEDGLNDILLSFVAIQEVFGDIWKSDLARQTRKG